MFERFTESARGAILKALEAARELEHNRVGTEQLLLGLLSDPGNLAVRALEALGVSSEVLRAQLEELSGRGYALPSQHLPFTPEAKHALELGLEEAVRLDQIVVGTGHLLLGLLREQDCGAARALVELGAELGPAREQVRELVERSTVARDHPAARAALPGARVWHAELAAPAPELYGVIPVARAVELPGNRCLYVIALELWSPGCELRYAVVPPDGAREGALAAFTADRWSLSDDLGSDYEVEQRSRRTRPDQPLWPASVRFAPAPPDDAKALTVTLAHPGLGELARLELPRDQLVALAPPPGPPPG